MVLALTEPIWPAEIVPVVKIDGRIIGDGKPGAMTGKLVAQYHALTKSSGEPIYG